MPPQRLITVTRGIQMRGQPIKNYKNFFLKIFEKHFQIYFFYIKQAKLTYFQKKLN